MNEIASEVRKTRSNNKSETAHVVPVFVLAFLLCVGALWYTAVEAKKLLVLRVRRYARVEVQGLFG